jgi:hypothetical protein
MKSQEQWIFGLNFFIFAKHSLKLFFWKNKFQQVSPSFKKKPI